jgi:hypothetical protein
MNTYGLTKDNKSKEKELIAEILRNEYFPQVKTQKQNHPRIIHIHYRKTNGSLSHILALA